ncbi:TrkH family potassium uptake protein [Pseudalkalibacillus hwajinpoensis]|uniref:TrkH family potassium uptake protein n=1 Tax=Guptibacillus hwajinpoensis TaxID=208199 RepID=UPI001CFE1367|nr:potassium transporter TrkG [Pseudalkalibacillus hwajinpoensis]
MLKTKSTIQSFRYIFITYVGTIVLFAFLYLLPFSHYGSLQTIDSLFISTSALSVTGLSSVNISTDFTRVGQALLIIEMQLGGIGILVLVSYLFLMMGKKLTMSSMLLISKDQNQSQLKTIRSLSLSVLMIALTVEAIGFSLMFNAINDQYSSIKEAVFVTVFHSVASFTNAGFDLFGDSLISYQHNWLLLLTSATMIFLGSLGFPTIVEYILGFRKKKSLFTKVNIRLHSTLFLVGLFLYFFLEHNGVFHHLSLWDKFVNVVFLSATSRNGGLTTVDISTLDITSVLVLMSLMFIGGSSSSTGGGLRLTTFAVLLAKMVSVAKSEEYTTLFKKTISQDSINKSFLIFLSFIFLFAFSTIVLSYFESQEILLVAFEVISALTNTGLSMGITGELAGVSKLLLCMLMIIGRIGVFSFIYAVFKIEKSRTRYIKEDLAVG